MSTLSNVIIVLDNAPSKSGRGYVLLDKEEILYEQLQKQYDITLKQTDALCNVVTSLKSVFKYLIVGGVIVAIVIAISYFWSPDSYSVKVNGDNNKSVESGDIYGKEE